jgi:hypothetical protein
MIDNPKLVDALQVWLSVAFTKLALFTTKDLRMNMMSVRKHRLTISAFCFFTAVGCTNTPKKTAEFEGPKISAAETQEGRDITGAAALQANAHNFVEIDFSQASSFLSNRSKTALESSIEQAKKYGDIKQIIVLSWADEEYPSQKQNKLSNAQRALADKRNSSIKSFFKTFSRSDVETYNMAERPNILSKWFNTSDSQLKRSLVAAGLPTTADELQYPSKAAHSVVLIKVE